MAEVVEEKMLVLVDGSENNNKFYHLTLDANGNLVKRWGRVGANGQTMTETNKGKVAFDRIVHEKERKGYRTVNVVKQTVGKDAGLGEIAKSTLIKTGTANPELERLIEKLVTMNKHEIVSTSGGLISVSNDGAISTPLGMIDLATIDQARRSLTSLAQLNGQRRVSALEEYLSLIPQAVPRARGWQDTYLTGAGEINQQATFLDQLRDSVAFYEDKKRRAQDTAGLSGDDLRERYKDLFRYQVDVLDAKDKRFKKIRTFYEQSKNRSHSSHRLDLKRVYTLVPRAEEEATYTRVRKELGNERELWHGTRAFNLLSILRKGLFVPPVRGTSVVTTGRMFGDGIYLSDQSTKSLNYSYGYWGGGSASRDSNCFMLLADVVLGHEFRPAYWNSQSASKAHNGVGPSGKRYNSINIKGGTCNVLNNELIVWDTEQIALRYICEFDA